ncbi:MAG: 50S ribosomal protein L35 [Lentisphaerae bacterium RIFOXYC12_FULL_60_16]|nr:MAG: 50S ribosomal protein L35 [Lentisphaerae bacterium RIFOXYC12_FULL_60_16]OGV74128.1 MAG: 50S ribosomal protein L35 [Lentisphaerae bacterium RIFOXYA12_FULL_60_10]OGV86052.1 MAG: 50S ribosomal protein L35 [Lentisphaerae bacterium RIFOXYB12_FULL_60_10]
MPKKKTNKAAAKRLRFTARGKVRFAMAGSGHLLTGKSRKRKRNMRNSKAVLSKSELRRVRELLTN